MNNLMPPRAPQTEFETLILSGEGRPDPPGLSRCIIKAKGIGQFSRNAWRDGTKITKNMNMPMCQYAFKTNEISIIWCPSGPLKGAPRPPRASRGAIKAERIGQFAGNACKDIQKITRNMTMPMCHYAFETYEISTIWCRLRTPEGPPGSPGGAPRPPCDIQMQYKSRENWSIFRERNKDHEKHEHANVPICL